MHYSRRHATTNPLQTAKYGCTTNLEIVWKVAHIKYGKLSRPRISLKCFIMLHGLDVLVTTNSELIWMCCRDVYRVKTHKSVNCYNGGGVCSSNSSICSIQTIQLHYHDMYAELEPTSCSIMPNHQLWHIL